MGQEFRIKCSTCDYSITVATGVGFAHSPNAVFYGKCDDPTQGWSTIMPDGMCEKGKPLLVNLVDDEEIKSIAIKLLKNGAKPSGDYIDYGLEVYACPKCMQLDSKFYFKLESPDGSFEPDYRCSKCNTVLNHAKSRPDNDDDFPGCETIIKNLRKLGWKCPECGNCVSNYDEEDLVLLWD